MDSNLCMNSLNDGLIYITLSHATSQDVGIMKPAEQKLIEWETQPGFYASLSKIVSSRDVELPVRWLAIVCLKNGADKYWRNHAPNGISIHEKSIIRTELLKCFDEPTDVIAAQLAVLIAKISRMDWPREWPDLVAILIDNVKNNDSKMLRYRSLLILCHVVKTLSSKRLPGDKKLFYELSANIYPIMFEFWNYTVGNVLTADSHHRKTVEYKCELDMSLLTAKILSKLTVHGSNKPHLCAESMNFMGVIFERTKTLLEFRLTLGDANDQCKELVEKHAITLIKVLFLMLETHPLSYVDFIDITLQYSFYYCFTEEGSKLVFEAALIRWLNMMKMMLICREYSENKLSSVDGESIDKVHKARNAFFTPEVTHQIFYRFVNDYMILGEEDLALWDADPEIYAAEKIGEGCTKYNVKPCVESLFIAFLSDYRIREILLPIVVNIIENNYASPDPNDMNAILRKDAVYNVFGLSVFFLFNDEICYDKWFTEILVPELRVKNANYRILRRRIAWLIGKWTGVKLSPALYPLMCAEIIDLLEPSEDIAVRLAAANTMKQIVDDFEFRSEVFVEYIPRCFQYLYTLLEYSKECETKMQVLTLLSFIIERRVGWELGPFFESLVSYLPRLWHHSSEQNMLRCAIVSTLTRIVHGLGDQCVSLDKFVMLVIEYSLDLRTEGHVYLLEDGLHLLMAYIENVSKNDNVLSIFHYLPPLIERSTEHLTVIVNIVSGMLLLSPDKFLQMHGLSIVQTLMDLLCDVNLEGISLIIGFFETCIKVRPHHSIELLSTFLQQTIMNTRSDSVAKPIVVTLRLSIIARIILFSIESFARLVEKASNERNLDRDVVFANYMDFWLYEMTSVWYAERRKLSGLALARLLTAGSKIVLDRFSSIFSTIVEVLNDIMVSEEDGSFSDMLYATEDGGSISSETEEQELKGRHELRMSEVTYNDPVHKIDFPVYFQTELEQLRKQIGDTNFQQLMNTISPDSVKQLQVYIKQV